MRLALYQGPAPVARARRPADVRDAYLAEISGVAATADADLLVCPEMSATGYNIGLAAIEALAEAPDWPIFQRLSALAREHGIALVYGYPERAADGIFNALQAIGPDGSSLAGYRKCHLFGDLDRSLFAAGGEPLVQFTLDGWRIGLLTCYDVEFPEAVRVHALGGTDLLVVPTGLMSPFDEVANLLVPARALESQLFVAYANRCGTEGDLDYLGSSCVVGPDGHDIVRAGRDEQIVYAEISTRTLVASRAENPYLVDRRPELYADLARPGTR
jgi:predicted amidohydrolase